jgi:hypothetical protein
MKVFLTILFSIFCILLSEAQIDSVGSGHAMVFDGVDDYVDLGNIYDDVTLPFTISAWVNIDVDAGPCPVFISQSQDQSPAYKGFWMYVSPTAMSMEYGDGQGGNNPAFRRGKVASISGLTNRWIHICGVYRAKDNLDLYVNGINVGGSISGSSSLPMASNFPNEVARIGLSISNGVFYRFKGRIDELRIFKIALTQDEIRNDMTRKLTGKETGLIGYWTFDETSGATVYDKSPNKFNGQTSGNPLRDFSGAALGNTSVATYPGTWSGTVQTLTSGDQKVEVSKITGNPAGIHIYQVSSLPSQTQNLNLANVSDQYFGVFTAALDNDNGFTSKHYVTDELACNDNTRNDNHAASWNASTSPVLVSNRFETISAKNSVASGFSFDLGSDKQFCDVMSYKIPAPVDSANKSFLWNTGQTTPSITVNTTGEYKLTVTEGCESKTDSVKIDLLQTPPDFSLGPDEVACGFNGKILKPFSSMKDFAFTWQDGSHNDQYVVNMPGEYWAQIQNACGSESDTVELIAKVSNLAFDLGADKVLCELNTYQITTSIDPTGKTFNWNTGETTQSISPIATGKYTLSVSDGCNTFTDSVKLAFLKTPASFSLGPDQVACAFNDVVLQPSIGSDDSLKFTWQDGTHSTHYIANSPGKYSLQIENQCGIKTDTVGLIAWISHLDFNLGPDKELCDANMYTLSPSIDPNEKTFLWSTGETSESINATISGKYILSVSDQCNTQTDSIIIFFLKSPSHFSLGPDQVICPSDEVLLNPVSDAEGFGFTWQDGSHEKIYNVISGGKYWLQIENSCGAKNDTITFTSFNPDDFFYPNVITPNGDDKNQVFKLDERMDQPYFAVFDHWGTKVFERQNYKNDWDGDGLADGVYFYRVLGKCAVDKKGWISITR